ncbi:MAG TPA: sulfocyanin-like copper-binding protein [Candidatus Limnocylindria bacterium]|nr:sulfocyanin-like copper-binding protein [Candidatus Limnocylindria bacterium]
MRKLKLVAMLAIAAALAMGCTAAAAPTTVAAPTQGGTVNATLTDMKIAVDRTSISAGPVTFVVKNSGVVVHELVVIQTDVAQDKMAMGTEEVGKMDETGNIGETGEVIVGGSNTFTVNLPAGHYVLMCNEVGHYSSGMHMAFTVN